MSARYDAAHERAGFRHFEPGARRQQGLAMSNSTMLPDAASTAPVSALPRRKPVLLIVDDEAAIREVVSAVLEDEGYRPRQAATAEEALAQLAKRAPGLVLLDIWLEGSKLDGIQLLERIRAEGDRALVELTRRFDRLAVRSAAELAIDRASLERARAALEPELRAALELAAERIRAFHERQRPADQSWTDELGVRLGLRDAREVAAA